MDACEVGCIGCSLCEKTCNFDAIEMVDNLAVIDQEKCKKCGMCMKPGCPAITKLENGTTRIDTTMCNGCGLCKSQCKFGAIQDVPV